VVNKHNANQTDYVEKFILNTKDTLSYYVTPSKKIFLNASIYIVME